jgi:hypothetical protein
MYEGISGRYFTWDQKRQTVRWTKANGKISLMLASRALNHRRGVHYPFKAFPFVLSKEERCLKLLNLATGESYIIPLEITTRNIYDQKLVIPKMSDRDMESAASDRSINIFTTDSILKMNNKRNSVEKLELDLA